MAVTVAGALVQSIIQTQEGAVQPWRIRGERKLVPRLEQVSGTGRETGHCCPGARQPAPEVGMGPVRGQF